MLAVAWTTTWSSGPSEPANSRSASGSVAIAQLALLRSLEDGDLSEATVHVETDGAHAVLRSRHQSGRHDNYGFALAAQPGKSQGRPHRLSVRRYHGLPVSDVVDYPGRRSVSRAGTMLSTQ